MLRARRRYLIVSIVVATLVGGFVTLTACSNYGEGERCEFGNGNDDCADGLQCVASADLAQQFRGPDRCCPPDRSTAKVQACQLPTNSVTGEAGPPPPDTGPGVDATVRDTSVAPETGPDSAADADEGG